MFFPDHPNIDLVTRSLILGPVTILWVVVVVKVVGLRSFSKMTAFDFITTVAAGSLLANAASSSEWDGFLQPSLGIMAILFFQAVLAIVRQRSDLVKSALSNEPKLLFVHGRFCRDAMVKSHVTEDDLWAKMREANVMKLEDVEAIVLETTGDVSVLHGGRLQAEVLGGVGNVGAGFSGAEGGRPGRRHQKGEADVDAGG